MWQKEPFLCSAFFPPSSVGSGDEEHPVDKEAETNKPHGEVSCVLLVLILHLVLLVFLPPSAFHSVVAQTPRQGK